MPGCSKGSRGLSVQRRAASIFTGTTVSPHPSLRQRPSRYAFHAGRNLPDKEFRYLRTVIVTAAVYRGLGSELLPSSNEGGITPPLNLPAPGRRQSLYIGLAFAETCVFGKQSPGPFHCGLLGLQTRSPTPYARHPFFRRYGANLPSSLGRVRACALGSSPRLPVSVSGTGT